MKKYIAIMDKWSSSEMEKLIKMWADGLTATKIGEELFRSRHSVLSRVRRSGLARRNDENGRRIGKPETQKAQPKQKKSREKPRPFRRKEPTELRREKKSRDDTNIPREFYNSRPAESRCHFIDGDKREAWNWCGAHVKKKSSYCSHHHNMCYVIIE